jgi:guanidinoacetate N-methyltransferase
MDTVKSRKSIGFPSRQEEWCEAPAVYDEHTLRIAGHPVMEDWEKNYMDMLAAIAASKGGTVLELGYGMGLSATAIQTHNIGSHVVIECHPDVIQRCISDFKPAIDRGGMHIYSGFWQDVTPTLQPNLFNGILFDTYPLDEKEIHANHFWFFKEAFRLLKPGGILTYYSDEATGIEGLHRKKLLEAGFRDKDIKFDICSVSPPDDCEYWQDSTILAPIIRKAPALRVYSMRRRFREPVKGSH